jgi:phosphoserine phosphatase RsbU/P
MADPNKPEPLKEEFFSTMRIEIPPDLDIHQAESPKNGTAEAKRPPTRRVIRLPKPAPPGRDPFGAQDFQALLQNIYDAVLIADTHGQVMSVNVRAVQFFGYATSEFTQLNVVQLISGATEELLSTICQTLQSDRFVLIEACCNRKDRTFFPSEISVNRLRLSSTEYLSFFIRNITLRKEAEERLRTSDTAMRNSGSGIVITDADGNLQYCNPAMCKLWGLEDADVENANVRDFLADPGLADEMNQTVQAGGAWSREVPMKRRDGGMFFAQVSVAPNVNPDGELAGMVLSLLDISVLKHAQAELEDYAQKLRQRNAEMEDDLKMAREVQLTFLPREYPRFPPAAPADRAALGFSHLYHPSGMVGGDFFDIIPISDTKAGILIADVAGHGVKAALVVATIRGLIEQLRPVATDPAAFFTQLNQTYLSIFVQTGEVMFTTALYVVLDVTSGHVSCSSAGHLPPFRLNRAAGTAEQLRFTREVQGPGLGLYETSRYQNLEFSMQAGELLLLFTDGLSDVMDRTGHYYDTMRLSDCLAANLQRPAPELLKEMVADARRFSGRTDFEDDLCLLSVEILRLGNQSA